MKYLALFALFLSSLTALAQSPTPNLGLQKPARSTPNWDIILNGNFDIIDTAVAAKAPSNSPALTGTPTAPTPTTSDNSTRLATTGYVKAQPITAVNGTSVPVNTVVDQVLLTSAPGVGGWSSLASCANDGIHALTWTHAGGFVCSALTTGTSGTVNNFGAASNALFTTSVDTPTSTPYLNFNLVQPGAHQFWGNNTGSPANPAYFQPAFTDLSGSIATGQQPTTTVNAVTNDTNINGTITAQNLTLSWAGTLAKGRQNAATIYSDQTNAYGAGQKQTFASDTTNAGMRKLGVTADPSTLVAGDEWYRTDTKRQAYSDGTLPHYGMNLDDILLCAQFPTLTGDVTTSGASCATTIAAGAVTSAKLATANKTFTKTITVNNFTDTTGSGKYQFEFAQAVHLTRVTCNVLTATNAIVNFDKRSESTANTDSGNHLLGSDITCVSGGANATTWANASSQCGGTTSCAIPARTPVAMTITSQSGGVAGDVLRMHVEYTLD